MSITLSCAACGWTGTVVDSLAGETIACRNCADPLPVPSAKTDDGTDYEVIDTDGPKPKLPDESAKETSQAAIERAKKAAARKKKAILPEERPWRLSPKLIIIIGVIAFAAGATSFIVDTILIQFNIYPFILLGLGSVIAVTGYMFDHAAK